MVQDGASLRRANSTTGRLLGRVGGQNSLRKTIAYLLVLAGSLWLAGCQASGPAGSSLAATGTRLPAPEMAPEMLAPDLSADKIVFALEPFKSAPGNTADDISRTIVELARREGLVLTRRNGPDTTHRVLGYLSVTGDESRGVLIYVVDIFNRSGIRVHRFSGQEAIGASSGDPWAGVDRAAISNLAERTVRSLLSWANQVPQT